MAAAGGGSTANFTGARGPSPGRLEGFGVARRCAHTLNEHIIRDSLAEGRGRA